MVRLTEQSADGFSAVVGSLKASVRLLEEPEQSGGKSGVSAEGRAMHVDVKKKRKETRRCYNCGKVGHLKVDCKKPRKNKDEEGVVMLATSEEHVDTVVYFDSAATDYTSRICGICGTSGLARRRGCLWAGVNHMM